MRYALVMALMWLSPAMWAQNTLVERLSAIQVGTGVQLNWYIAQGNLCNGQHIERSEDGLFFTDIGFIDGVCGSLSEAVKYNFIDSMPPANTSLHYRIDLGPFGHSEGVELFVIDASERPFQLFFAEGHLHIRAMDANARVVLVLVGTDGRNMGEYEFTGRGTMAMPSVKGVVAYRAEVNGSVYSGRFWAH
jgi:hypothetical protein